MMTLLTLSMPWPYLVVIYPLCLLAFHVMAQQVRATLVTFASWNDCITAVIIWLYAAAATGMIMAPAPAVERLIPLLLSLFLFRMTLTDALTGFLPREMTVSCLLAGMIAALGVPGFWEHSLSSASALLIFGGWRFVASKLSGQEAIGLGDMWLAGGICAWLGGLGLYALLTGVVLFVLWQLSVRRTTEGGPMGPWLCAGALVLTLFTLYQPLITW